MRGTAALRRRIAAACAVVLLGVAGFVSSVVVAAVPAGAVPQTFVVNSLADPGDGTCDVAECTLREAMTEANASGADDDTITFSVDGTITVDGGSGPLPTGTDTPLTITGNGSGVTVIDGATNGITQGLAGSGLVVTGLSVSVASTGVNAPTGISAPSGDLSLADVVVTATSTQTGTQAFGVTASSGSIALTGSTVTVTGKDNATGVSGSAAVTIESSAIDVSTDASVASLVAYGCRCSGTPVSVSGSTITVEADNTVGGALAYGCRCNNSTVPLPITDSTIKATASATASGASAYPCDCNDVTVVRSTLSGSVPRAAGPTSALTAACVCDEVDATDAVFTATIGPGTLVGTADVTSVGAAGQACQCGTVTLVRTSLTATVAGTQSSIQQAYGCNCGDVTATDSPIAASARNDDVGFQIVYGCNCGDVDLTSTDVTADATSEGTANAYGCSCDQVEADGVQISATAFSFGGGTADASGCSCGDVGTITPATDTTVAAEATSIEKQATVYGCSCGNVRLDGGALTAEAEGAEESYAAGCGCSTADLTDVTLSAAVTGGPFSEADGCSCGAADLLRSTVIADATGDQVTAIGVDGGAGSATNVTFSVTATGAGTFAWAWNVEDAVEINEVTAVVSGESSSVFSTLETTTIANSILVGNCGTYTSLGGNVALTGSGCGGWMTEPNDKLVADALLQPLADNGGPGKTFMIGTTSPAFDNGLAANCTATDERGVTRPQFAACDSGAVELAPAPPEPPVDPLEPRFTG